jgi:hypothetical protein
MGRDPLRLWKIIKDCHQTLTTSKVASVMKKTAREEYTRLDAYQASGNLVPSPEGIGMDVLYGLDNSRYTDFKA